MTDYRGITFTNDTSPYDFGDKQKSIFNYIITMLNRTRRIFEYENLPETIPEKYIENYNQVNGFSCWAEHDGKMYVFFGGLGGEPDEYYFPTICTVANPALKLSKQYKINTDCVIMQNDTMMQGLLPIFNRYATQLAENDISINEASVNLRAAFLITAPDDRTYQAAVKFLQDMRDGKQGVIADNAFLDGVKVQPMTSSQMHNITELIELQQYCKASWYNELGLNANYNMKREALSMTESQMNFDALLPLIDDMLKCRQDALDKINAMFGTNITVHLSSSWEKIEQQADISAHAENPENDSIPDTESNETGGN